MIDQTDLSSIDPFSGKPYQMQTLSAPADEGILIESLRAHPDRISESVDVLRLVSEATDWLIEFTGTIVAVWENQCAAQVRSITKTGRRGEKEE